MTIEMEIRHAAYVAREEGYTEGHAEGDTGRLVSQICKKLKKGMSVAQIADAVEEDEARVQLIVDLAQKYAPDYDVDKIVQELLQTVCPKGLRVEWETKLVSHFFNDSLKSIEKI